MGRAVVSLRSFVVSRNKNQTTKPRPRGPVIVVKMSRTFQREGISWQLRYALDETNASPNNNEDRLRPMLRSISPKKGSLGDPAALGAPE